MFIKIFNTWTIYILLPLSFPAFSLGAVADERKNEIQEPTTMYDAVIKRCPNLESKALKDSEIFTNKCLKWAEINATSSFSVNTKSNVECLLLYEALVAFCTDMGDTLHMIQLQGIIPTISSLTSSNYTIRKVCEGTYDLYSTRKTEHNISSLIRNIDSCLLLCLDFSLDHISDVCKFAYYFASFNASKFTKDLEVKVNHHDDADVHAKEPNKVPSVPILGANNTKQAQDGPDKDVQEIPQNIAPPPVIPKPQNTENDNQGDSEPKDTIGSKQKVESKDQPNEAAQQPDTEAKIPAPPLDEPSGLQNKSIPVVPAAKDTDIEESPQQQEKAVAKPEKSPPGAAPEKDKKPEIKDEQLDPEDDVGEKSQGLNGDDTDQEILPNEGEQDDDDDVKDEIPVENNESKTTAKKIVKPNTVDDGSISSFNTPEDDMDGDSYFFSYFTVIMCLFIVGYVGYHNRQKILALILEGKRGRRSGRGRRPNSANYHKLDTNLEEAISSSCTKSASNVIY